MAESAYLESTTVTYIAVMDALNAYLSTILEVINVGRSLLAAYHTILTCKDASAVLLITY